MYMCRSRVKASDLTFSSLYGLSQFTSSSDGASGIDGVSVGDGLLSSPLK